MTLDRLVKCQNSRSGDSKDGGNKVDGVRLLELGNLDKEKSLARPILLSNWLSKNYIQVERGKLRDYTKARLGEVYEEEQDGLLELFNEEEEDRYQPGHSPRHQDENEEEEAKHQTTHGLRYQAKNKEEEPK